MNRETVVTPEWQAWRGSEQFKKECVKRIETVYWLKSMLNAGFERIDTRVNVCLHYENGDEFIIIEAYNKQKICITYSSNYAMLVDITKKIDIYYLGGDKHTEGMRTHEEHD